LFQCHRCHGQTSVTAGTVFQNTRLPLRTWFLAIYLLTQSKNGLSALALKRHLGVSYNTAWLVKHKLMQAMKEHDDTQLLEGVVQLDDAYWGGERRGKGTGRGTQGKTPFVAAVSCTEEGQPVALRMTVVEGFRSDGLQSWTARHVKPGSLLRIPRKPVTDSTSSRSVIPAHAGHGFHGMPVGGGGRVDCAWMG